MIILQNNNNNNNKGNNIYLHLFIILFVYFLICTTAQRGGPRTGLVVHMGHFIGPYGTLLGPWDS